MRRGPRFTVDGLRAFGLKLKKREGRVKQGDGTSQAPWIVAHRGARREAPENTGAAFDAALAYPIDGIELDIQLSRDGIPVVFHDKTLTKAGAGRKRISDLTLRELHCLDWGSWFAKGFAHEPLLTLHETLQTYAGQTRLLIEIKSFEKERRRRVTDELTNQVLREISKRVPRRLRNRLFILAFDMDVLATAMDRGRRENLVLNLPADPRLDREGAALWRALYGFCLPIGKLSRGFVTAAHERGQKVMTYSCNRPYQLRKALNFGVDTIMTDDPRWLFRYLKTPGVFV
ncbi:MAG: glycerophosphodiester phosphodiesterase family protein [bacterium]|nr:glycerophosphodiester phosphodiesterase family protein [bacterium]